MSVVSRRQTLQYELISYLDILYDERDINPFKASAMPALMSTFVSNSYRRGTVKSPNKRLSPIFSERRRGCSAGSPCIVPGGMEKLCAASQNSDGFGSYRRRSGIKDGPDATVVECSKRISATWGRSLSRHNEAREHIEQQQPSSEPTS
jgi:hypothetical protein